MGTLSTLNPLILSDLATLLDYPGDAFLDTVIGLCARIQPQCPPDAAAALGQFVQEATALGCDQLEELHTRTFSLTPICVPYVGVQIFGENNFKRGELIAGLARDLEAHGIDVRPELPDHLASMLRLAARLPQEELEEMVTWCLAGAAQKIAASVSTSSTPYRHLLQAINLTLCTLQKELTAHAG